MPMYDVAITNPYQGRLRILSMRHIVKNERDSGIGVTPWLTYSHKR